MTDSAERIACIREALQALPEANSMMLTKLFALLYEISKYQEENKMTFGNLATVIGPTLLRPKSDTTDNIKALQDVSRSANVVLFILEQYEQLFGEKVLD
jgi:hypothetical protein